MNVKVRSAQQSDIDWIVEELRHFAAFAKLEYLFDNVQATVKATAWINNPNFYFGLAYDEDTQDRLGFIAAIVSPHLFNDNVFVLSELFWWVAEDKRHSRAGSKLLDSLIAYGVQRGVSRVYVSIEHLSPIKPESLLKRGFKNNEQNFVLEV